MSGSIEGDIRQLFQESVAAKRRFLEENLRALATVVDLVSERLLAGNKILLFGNGGSAADAQHIAAEFVNRFMLERPPLPAIALTTDSSVLTSISNDYGYADVFAKQVKALGREGDVAVALSTSGNSPNVIRAVEACRKKKIHTVGLTGGDGGKLGAKVDHHLCVTASKLSPRIQETHILVGHVICELVDRKLFGPGAGTNARE
ncbi:MAG: D-sedoheptulose-7-phosphate isomerase [Candidatus Binatia bacterium]